MSDLLDGESIEEPGVLLVDGWAGRREIPVRILPGKGRKWIRVRLLAPARLRNRACREGDVVTVPAGSVRSGR